MIEIEMQLWIFGVPLFACIWSWLFNEILLHSYVLFCASQIPNKPFQIRYIEKLSLGWYIRVDLSVYTEDTASHRSLSYKTD